MRISNIVNRRQRSNAAAIGILLLATTGICRAEVHLTEAQAKAAAVVKTLPEYPVTARQLKVTGKVELEIEIDTDGLVKGVKILTGSPILTRPCAKVVADWKFKPFQEDGKPAEAVAPISFEFR